MDVTQYLIDTLGFEPVRPPSFLYGVDIERWSASKRIGEIHHLMYSEVYGHFSIVVKHDRPKGLAGGGKKPYTSVMLPRVCRDTSLAKEIVKALDPDFKEPVKGRRKLCRTWPKCECIVRGQASDCQ